MHKISQKTFRELVFVDTGALTIVLRQNVFPERVVM